MFSHCHLKNKYWIKSKRTFLEDYSSSPKKKINMVLSGKYLGEYPNFNIDEKNLDCYPSNLIIPKFEEKLKKLLGYKGSIVLGGGVDGLLQNLIKIFFTKKGNLVTPYLTFNQAEFAVTSMGAYTKRVFMNNNSLDLYNILNSIDRKTRMVYICNPNNLTGEYVESKELAKIVNKINKKIAVVIDESGIEFAGESISNYGLNENIVILRSFSKCYGLAGARIGYMLCSNEILDLYKRNVSSNTVSTIACNIAEKMLKNNLYKQNIDKIIEERNKLSRALKLLGIETYISQSNVLFTKNSLPSNFIENLYKNEVSVLPCLDQYNDLHIRIAVQDEKTNDAFIKKLKYIKQKEII